MPNPSDLFPPSQAAELLDFAQQLGRAGVVEWDVPSGRVRLSPVAMSLYGITEFDGTYASWAASVHPEDQPKVRDVVQSALAARTREFEVEFRMVRPDGEIRWLHARRLAFYADDGTPLRVVGVSADITERKREILQLHHFNEALEEAVRRRTQELEAENEARKKAEQALRQAQKMEAIGQLTGGVAHDFNNLLTIVIGGLDLIGRQMTQLPEQSAISRIERAKDTALQGARRAAALTNRLLAFSRQQPLAPQPIDANRLLTGMSEFLHSSLGETVEIEAVHAAGLWRAAADPSQLENALLNLALNARDAMPDGGRLTIETANSFLDDAYVSQLAEPVAPGQYVMISVTDTGQGMDAETSSKAFDPFFTTKAIGRGTGLGLSMVYGFVRQSGGHVRIYSEVGEGTSVKIYLPRTEDTDAAPAGQNNRAMPVGAEGKEHILLVEDDDQLRAFTADLLWEMGYHVVSAASGAQALRLIDTETIDLLFTDIVMPGGMNGRQLADEAKRRRPALKVLFTTGYTRNAVVHHGRLDRGVHLLSKPYSMHDLAVKLRQVLDG